MSLDEVGAEEAKFKPELLDIKRQLIGEERRVCQLPAAALDSLANDPDVVHVSADHKLGAMLDNSAAAVNASAAGSPRRTQLTPLPPEARAGFTTMPAATRTVSSTRPTTNLSAACRPNCRGVSPI